MDSPLASAPRGGRGGLWLGLAVLALLASWPWVEMLGYWPMTADPPTWISRGTPLNPDWLSWVFAKDHYSWYRPVAALTFAANQVLVDVEPLLYRLTDLALHLGVGLLASAVFRRWFPGAPLWTSLAVAALVWVHPIAEEVVPYMARRSYSLAACFGLAALCALHTGVERVIAGAPTTRAGPLTGALLVLALFSNEAAISTVVVVPLFVAARLRGREHAWGEGLRLLVPTGLVVAVAMVVRVWILGGLGGYEDPGQSGDRVGGILVPLVEGLTGTGRSLARVGTPLVVLLVGLGAYYACAALRGLSPRAAPEDRLVLVAGLWLALAACMFLVMGIYSPRQAYGLQVPLAFAAVGAWSIRPRLVHALPLVALAALLLSSSPVVHGQWPPRRAGWAQRQALLQSLNEDLRACEQPALVRLVLPNMRPTGAIVPDERGGGRLRLHRSIRQPSQWTQIALHAYDVELRDFVYYPHEGEAPRVERGPDGVARVVLPDVPDVYQRKGQSFVQSSGTLAPESLSWPADRNAYFYVYANGVGELVAIEPRR